jgi:AraC-like DNA-binding protein
MPKETIKINGEFPDVSALGQAMGFDIDFRQLDNGDSIIPATALISENITLTHMHFARRYHQLGLPPAGQLTFGVPVNGMRDWFGSRYRTSSILPFHQPGGIDGVSGAGFRAYTISFTENYLNDIARDFQVPVPGLLHNPGSESTLDRGESNNRLRGMLYNVFNHPSGRLSPECQEEMIITLLQAGLNHAIVSDRSSPESRNLAIRKAVDYVADHCEEIVTLRDICVSCGVSLRTLNRAFNERFGLGPKMYLKRQRLSAVRNKLLASPPGTLVSDIANRWGFWHMGQFARDYALFFGELPSQTLKQPWQPWGQSQVPE